MPRSSRRSSGSPVVPGVSTGLGYGVPPASYARTLSTLSSSVGSPPSKLTYQVDVGRGASGGAASAGGATGAGGAASAAAVASPTGAGGTATCCAVASEPSGVTCSACPAPSGAAGGEAAPMGTPPVEAPAGMLDAGAVVGRGVVVADGAAVARLPCAASPPASV